MSSDRTRSKTKSKDHDHLRAPTLQRNDSAISSKSGRSIHSQKAHHSHYSLDDPSATLAVDTMANGHHIHHQHGDIFVAGHGVNMAPDLEALIMAEQQEQMESDLEDEAADIDKAEQRRRRSVAFSPSAGVVHSKSRHIDAADEIAVSETSTPGSSGMIPIRDASTHKYDTVREGSIVRRPRWRRPGLNWLLPVVTCFAVTMGMGSAPKQELMINLACLAHPPQTQNTERFASDPAGGMTAMHMARSIWNAPSISKEQLARIYDDETNQAFLTDSFVGHAINKTIDLPPLTPADRWMIDVQHRIAADRARRKEPKSPQTQIPVPLPSDGDDLPGGQVPHRPVGSVPEKDRPSLPDADEDYPAGPHGPRKHGNKHDEYDRKPVVIDPRLCKKSPNTLAAAATLTMVMTLSMGILSALTTGFWGAVSDRLGRTKVMSIAVLGLVSNDVILILTATYPHKVPFGYRFIILGPLLDGLLGGFSTITATNHAYLSDVTLDGSRANVFGRVGGIMMCGFSMGPILGSALIRMTGSIMSVFYLAALVNSCLVLFVAFVLPESLSSEARAALSQAVALKKHKLAEREAAERAWEEESEDELDQADNNASSWSRVSGMTARSSKNKKKFRGRMKRLRRRMFSFLSPLRLFIPQKKEYHEGGRVVSRKDCNLLFLILSISCMSILMGLLQLKAQFLIYRYGWSSAELGPYLTVLAGLRGFILLGFMPLIVKLFKPKIKAQPDQTEEDVKAAQAAADSHFDLSIIRLSLLVDIFGYIGMAFLVPAPVFVLLTCLVSFGSCAGPAGNSLALNLIDSSRDAGRLFGGLSVVQAMSSAFLGPLVFSLVFAKTVGTYSPTVFGVAVIVLVIAQIFLSFIRLPRVTYKVDAERGRPRRTKRVKSSSMSQGGSP